MQTYTNTVATKDELREAIRASYSEIVNQRKVERFCDATPIMQAFILALVNA